MTKINENLDPAAALAGERVLITGSSGFIGTHLTKRLAERGVTVLGVDLKPPRERLPGVTYVTGDVRELSQLQLPKADRIFNLAAVHTTPGHPDHEYYDTNVNGALEVVRLAERDGVRHVVFTSSISVYGPSEDRKTETSDPAPVSAYGKSKLMAEKIHEGWLRNGEGRSLTVVRPAVVFGAGEGGNFTRMATLLKRGVFVFPGRRDTIKSCIYVEDLIDLVLAAAASEPNHVVFNGSYPECPTLETIVVTLQERFFPKAKLIDVPLGVVMAAAKGLSTLNGLGVGVHPDRVTKLVRSTHVFPEWAVENQMFADRSFTRGVERWSTATGQTFV
ncbi:MAG: NAD(P)-dependent oxidoreductase [Caulobacter sp.]|nr:NAD(P)-dependent oxidoreductase [Caulobacter sp.]